MSSSGISLLRLLPRAALLLTALLQAPVALQAADLPRVDKATGQLLVNGQPYLVLGGELGNSSAGTAAQADDILPRLAAQHLNTVLVPVAWEQIEPREGTFDFSVLDHWIDVAREQHLHVGLLWFGAWKNAFSNYTPTWVKEDTTRFPRALSADGLPLEILSTLGPATLEADRRAFVALLQHVREKDAAQQTVLLVQVENEVGYLGRGGRDRSPEANKLFHGEVPTPLLASLRTHRADLSPELRTQFDPQATTWSATFGDAADEAFMAFQYARYIEALASAGKRAYPLPLYANCQLPAPAERAGEYPSGAPYPAVLDIYRATAPSLDFLSPDIYWPDFTYWINRYKLPNNPVFIPEARLDAAPWNALYAYGGPHAFGFSAFGVDGLPTEETGTQPTLASTYAALASIQDLVLSAQARNATRALVLHASSPRPTQTIAIGGFLFEASLSRTWPAKSLLTDDGGLLLIQTTPNEFLALGSGLTINVYRDPDTDNKTAGIASIEEVTRDHGQLLIGRRLNGDQSNQGRQLSLEPKQIRLYRVRLYTYSSTHG